MEDVERGRLVENLHNALYGHGFVAIETSRESFRQRCRLHAKWKEYLGRGSVCACVAAFLMVVVWAVGHKRLR